MWSWIHYIKKGDWFTIKSDWFGIGEFLKESVDMLTLIFQNQLKTTQENLSTNHTLEELVKPRMLMKNVRWSKYGKRLLELIWKADGIVYSCLPDGMHLSSDRCWTCM